MAAAPAELVASGDNFTLHVDRGVVLLRVWSRSDMSFARGAELAQTKLEHLRQLVNRPDVDGLLFDLVDAAAVVGPVTEEAVRAMVRVFAERDHAVAVVVGDSPTQSLQFTRMLRAVGGRRQSVRGIVTRDRAEAEDFVRGASSTDE